MNKATMKISCKTLLLIVFIVGGFLLSGCSKKPDIEGIYLEAGGSGHFNIQKSFLGKYHVSNLYGPQISYKEKHLVFEYILSLSDEQVFLQQVFAPSDKIEGDWDLVQVNHPSSVDRLSEDKTFEPPIPSYLHRVNDERISFFFNENDLAWNSGRPPDTERLFDLADQLLSSHPDDLHIRILYLEALVARKDQNLLKKNLEKWKNDFESSNNQALLVSFHHVELALRAMRLSSEGKNAFDFLTSLYDTNSNLENRIEKYPQLLDYNDFLWPFANQKFQGSLNYLEMQNMLKVFRIEGFFLLLDGKREEALSLYTASYHLGQLLNKEGPPINRLIGIAFRHIVSGGFEIYVLNACETPEDLENFLAALEPLNAKEIAEAFSPSEKQFDFYIFGHDDRTTRHRVANAKFQNIRVAAAARHRLLSQGEFPKTKEEIATLLPEGMPVDPFDSSPMRFVSSLDSFISYSIGPDMEDGGGVVQYDPTNGTLSQGDVLLKVLREREYPFPKDGVRANTVEELKAIFPSGLPFDPFGPRRPVPGRVTISDTSPVYVYSRGPDLKVDTGNDIIKFIQENHYDPTNGTISAGDLFMEIPSQ